MMKSNNPGTPAMSDQATMQAMVFRGPGKPLALEQAERPEPDHSELLIRVQACGVCRTDLHIIDGELDQPALPLIPGHQIVGVVETDPSGEWTPGQRVGVPWLGGTCGHCEFCLENHENLCPEAHFTGYTRNGGFAEYAVADKQFCFALPENQPPEKQAPLLCAGLIGYRAWRFCGDSTRNLGIYGFGAAAHILTQIATAFGQRVFAFTRPGDSESQAFASRQGAVWTGNSNQPPPELLDAAIIFAPAGPLVPEALSRLKPAGRLILGGIHMSEIPAMPYKLLWGERRIQSVANLTRRDGEEFFEMLEKCPVDTDVHAYPLARAAEALEDLRNGRFTGAAVLQP
jgi:propanol-preferring alcohol dehydrogenase